MRKFFILIIFFILLPIESLNAQPVRQDALWARNVPVGTITLDGVLDEAEWASAESLAVVYGENAGLPTSGWRAEFQPDAVTDPTNAMVKFLASGTKLYIAFTIPDSSVGGTQDWARWDGILMSIKNKAQIDPVTQTALPAEFFYAYWLANLPNPTPIVGANPRFIGTFGNFNDTTRTPEQIAVWDARTIVDGLSNDDQRDNGWVVEMQIDLDSLGYNITGPAGDVVALNFSIWDCDYLFEGDPTKISSTRTHWQNTWGNVTSNNVGRIMIRPDITITSSPQYNMPDAELPPGGTNEVNIDGDLGDFMWPHAYQFEIGWNDVNIRNNYPGVGPLVSGQFQPELFGNPRPPVLDPSYGKLSAFFKNDSLYLAADINDQLVQGTAIFDKADGVGFIIGHRTELNEENAMIFKYLRINFDQTGAPSAQDNLPNLIDDNGAEFAVKLKGSTTVNNNFDIDEGYVVELKVDLTKLGYETGLGDKLLFMGAVLLDGDSFDDSLANYGTRTWWFREHAGGPAAAWIFMNENIFVNVEDNYSAQIPTSIELIGNYPNPFNPATKIKFSLPASGTVSVRVVNALGEEVYSKQIENLNEGINEFNFSGTGFSSGVYFYQISLMNTAAGIDHSSAFGKMILLK